MGKLENEIFVCIDCETTGLDPKKDRIIEVAAVIFQFDQVLKSFETLVDPGMPIPEESTKIHGITDEMVKDKPKIKDVLSEVFKVIDKHIIIGHAVQFDVDMLTNSAERENITTTIKKNKIIDTLRLARLYGDSPSNALEKLGMHFNVSSEGAHRAMNDVMVNIEVFKHLAKRYHTKEKLFEVLSKPILMKTMPFGKHKGRLLKDIPLQYLLFAKKLDLDDDLLFSIQREIKKRKEGKGFQQSANPFRDLK